MSETHTHDDGHTHAPGVGDDNVGFGHVHYSNEVDPTAASVDHLAGTIGGNGKPIWSADQAAEYLFRAGAGFGVGGNRIMPSSGDMGEIRFGFHTGQASLANNGYVYEFGGRYYGLSEYFNFAAFTPEQQAATREAMQYWDDVMAPSFVETHVDDADIAFGNYTNRPGTQAYARLTANVLTSNTAINEQIQDIGGDVWVARNTASNFHLDEGGYGMNTLVHEIGHGFGMLHPGDYNFSPGGPALSYLTHAEYYQDTRSYSILSYWNPRDIGARDYDWHRMTIAYGATPMVHDILAVQKVYGADMTTRTGDTIYGFNSNAGRDAFDFVKTPDPTMTIWDAGGNDTLDASGYGTNQIIDLTPGSLSSIGGITLAEAPTFAEVNAARAAAGMAPAPQWLYDANMAALRANPLLGRMTDNVGVAYGADIENAIGGRGNDLMFGNALNNVLTGNEGDDLMFGRDGDDQLIGGAGADTLDGGLGSDVLSGGAGDDQLRGGDGVDRMTGGAGSDTFLGDIGASTVEAKRGSLAMDIIVDFDLDGDDRFDFTATDANTTIEGIQAFTFVGRAAGKGAGELSFKTYGSVHAAEQVLGIELDGLSDSTAARKVTIVFGNTDADADAEFAFVLLGTNGVAADDFIL